MVLVKLMSIPERFHSPVDGDERGKVGEIIEGFFNNTRAYIESIHDKSKPHEFEIKSGEIKYDISRDSNDRLTYTLYEGRYVVAGVLEIRTLFNNIMYTFFRDLSFLEEPSEQ